MEQIVPVVAGILASATETLASPAAAASTEVPVRVRSDGGRWTPVTVSGRVLDDSGRLVALVRPAAERHAFDLVLERLGHGADLDLVLDALVSLVQAQFGIGQAWLIHDLDGAPATIGTEGDPGVGPATDLIPDLRAHGPSDGVVVRGDRWVVPVLSPTKESMFGILMLESPRDGGPSPYDLYVLDRVTTLASLAFTRAQDDRLLRRAATFDHLTGVINRRSFEIQLAQLALGPQGFPVTLFFVDIDEFKSVNDRFGHAAGDEVLAVAADRLVRSVRPGDAVGRLGGDEFAISCPGLELDRVESMMARLQAAFTEPVTFHGRQVHVSVSIGAAVAQDEDELADIVDRSDADMYRHKHARPERVLDTPR
jgi:diguanylate cyclase (GGDEF)-like protein